LSKIAFIAPDKHLFLQGKKLIKELNIDSQVDFYLARLSRGIRLAKRLQTEDVDVIICRGGTAHLIINAQIKIPVVEIVITGQDLAQVFYEAKIKTGLPHPKVAIHAFKNMIYDIEVLSHILGIDLTIYPLENPADIPAKIAEMAKLDIDIVAGGIKSITLAKQNGFKVLPIRSGDFSVRAAVLEAQKIALARKIEREQAEKFKSLVDYSIEGIISINCDKIITVFNPTAERLLNHSAQEMIGQNIESVLALVNIDSCLAEGQETLGQTIQFNTIWVSFNIAPIVVGKVIIGAMITFQDITLIQEIEAKIRTDVLARRMTAKYYFTDILGTSPQICEAKRIAQEMSAVNATVLISGESGTGKELFAQSIHNHSRRNHGPFVAINCGALPANLLESELFGYVDGAFTGATKKGKQGLFEMAHRGTIFLDEIAEMDKYGQSRLLRVLQERQVMRLGDDKVIPIDVRIIAATNKNLVALVKEGQFRQDLYYRLKVLTIKIPPLRQRINDIRILSAYFLALYNKQNSKNYKMTVDAQEYLSSYDWPGNVRELMYFIERLVVICQEQLITRDVISKYWDDREFPVDLSNQVAPLLSSQSEEMRIVSALTQSNSNITKAATLLGIDRSTLYRKLKAYKIEVKKAYS
jgi:PAS domain S-box-containing protein